MNSIQVDQLTKKYKNGVQALDNLSFHVKEGEIFTMLGKNGAGKSTLIKILTTFIAPTKGNVTMLGKDIYKEPAKIRKFIACAAQQVSIDTFMSLTENMMFQSKLYNVPREEAKSRMNLLIERFGLERYLQYPISSYSGGIKRRLDIALSMMSNPKILFLDEPTVGMDIQTRNVMWEMVRKVRNDFGTTVFLTTHYMEEAEMLSDSICIINNGRQVAQGSALELKDYLHQDMLSIRFTSRNEAIKYNKILQEEINLQVVDLHQDKIVAKIDDSADIFHKVTYFLLEHNAEFKGIEIMKPTLEDVFINFTDESGKEINGYFNDIKP